MNEEDTPGIPAGIGNWIASGWEAGSGPASPAVLSGYGEQWEMQYQRCSSHALKQAQSSGQQ